MIDSFDSESSQVTVLALVEPEYSAQKYQSCIEVDRIGRGRHRMT